jgi:hypothetical protein
MPRARNRTPQRRRADDEDELWKDLPSPDGPTIIALDEMDSQSGSLASTGAPEAPADDIFQLLVDAGISEGRVPLMLEDEDTMDLVQALYGRLGYLPALLKFLRGSEDELAAAANQYATSTPLEDIIEANIVSPIPSARYTRPSAQEVNPFEVDFTNESTPPATPAAVLKDKGKTVDRDPVIPPPAKTIRFTHQPATSNPARKKIQAAAAKEDEIRRLEGFKMNPDGTFKNQKEMKEASESRVAAEQKRKAGRPGRKEEETVVDQEKIRAAGSKTAGDSSKKRELEDGDVAESGSKRLRITFPALVRLGMNTRPFILLTLVRIPLSITPPAPTVSPTMEILLSTAPPSPTPRPQALLYSLP